MNQVYILLLGVWLGCIAAIFFIPPSPESCRTILIKDIQERKKLTEQDRKLSEMIDADFLSEVVR